MLAFSSSQLLKKLRFTKMYIANLIERDLNTIWHPCSQMKDYETFKPLEVVNASGCYFELKNGRKVIDAISSWWCKTLGHNHPRLKKALCQQVEKFEHILLANTTNATIVELSERLTNLTTTLKKVFYASDGSCAVEIALKMSLQARAITGDSKRNVFISLKNAYHGETLGVLSVSDMGIYREPFAPLLFKTHFISPLPYMLSTNDILWHDCQSYWDDILQQLEPLKEKTTAIIVEPIVQGAAGMKIYSQDFLKRLRAFTQKNNIHLIADEIMTGLGRTGKMLACQHAGIEPDFLCLGKSLTCGWLPMSAVLTSQAIYDLFYDDYATKKSFLHSHTFSGNVLAASIAIAALKLIEEENICARANQVGKAMYEAMQDIADATKKLKNVRSIGAIVAADLICPDSKRYGFEVFKKATELGALLRPLQNTIYWFLPLNIEFAVIQELKKITERAIKAVLN